MCVCIYIYIYISPYIGLLEDKSGFNVQGFGLGFIGVRTWKSAGNFFQDSPINLGVIAEQCCRVWGYR